MSSFSNPLSSLSDSHKPFPLRIPPKNQNPSTKTRERNHSLMEAQRFMRPTPPPPPPSSQPSPSHMGDPHHLHHLQQQQQQQQQQPRPPPPPPQGAPWYSGQFQFHASQPPSHQQQQPPPPMWGGGSSHPDHHHQSMPSHPQHNQQGPPYPPHPHNHYLPPPHHHHQPYSHPHQAYPQTWQNQNQAHHQGWEHPDRVALHNNEEDWAAKAKAWATAKSSVENQHPQSQFTPVGRPEEHNHVYHDQYRQATDPRYTDVHQPASNLQHFPGSPANPIRPPANHLQESAFNYGPPLPSEVPDGHMSYPGRDGALTTDSNPAFPLGSTPANSSMYQQEVPSSYSSVPGKEGGRDQNEQLHRHSPLPMSLAQEGRHHVQPAVPAPGRPASLEQPHFVYGNRSTDFVPDLCDRPLEFAPRFNREHDPYPQASYSHLDPAGTAGSVDHALTPSVGPGVAYPPIPPVPSGLQFDPSFVGPAIPGHVASMYGQVPGQNYRPNIPNVNAPFGLGSGTTPHPIAAFDVNGFSNISERPKKASVPNWLREEIIKKKAVITSSSQEFPERNPTNSGEEDGIEKSFTNGSQAGNRSTDSSRLSEDEDDDEDDVEAARTAAVNQEIKRVLTEVLLKVTDELFDEIATKVLSEDDLSVEVDYNDNQSNRKVSSSPSVVPTAKASAKVIIPVKGKETEADDASEKSSSGTPGDLLGLASYASDNDDDEEIPSSSLPNTRKVDASEQKSNNHKVSENIPGGVENGNSQAETEGCSVGRSHSAGDSGSSDNESDKKMKHESDDISTPFNGNSGNLDQKSIDERGKISNDAVEGKTDMKPKLLRGNVDTKRLMVDESQEREAWSNKSDRSDDQESKRNSADKDSIRGEDTSKVREVEKHSHSIDTRRHDQRHARKDKTNDRDDSKERVKDRGSKPEEKAKESDSRKRSRDDRKETENLKRLSEKEDSKRKRERSKDEKRDRSRHRDARDSSRHKRRRSSSIGSRGRHSKDNSVGSHGNDSSDGASEDSSRRKPPLKKRSLSPSPTRSRRRQVSRSPHSKHSQRRHSPYSSLESSRRKRSRSKSPVHRRR